MLFNERVLALDEEKTSLRYQMEDLVDIDLWEFSMNLRQEVKTQCRFHTVRVDLDYRTETQMKMANAKFEDIDRFYLPDRTQADGREDLFEFVEGTK